ncbi:alpha/beta fold hydrolase [Halobacillus litoralis]|uniref:alpha/beta fold hydrolase n=1 Tax=Halobacillus litoralis TaxID=45668 RepID=UPI001CFD3E70|nr:alpha/beta hydrolase [Halobacillus litoralis]
MENTVRYDYYVEKVGTGSPLIFLPGGGFSGNAGFIIADRLKQDFETHMIDLPGLGRSIGINQKIDTRVLADWMREYLDQQQIERAHLVGHSLGGAILLAFAVHYPERVNQLVLLDQGHKSCPKVPVSEFGAFGYAFPLLDAGVKLFGRPVLRKLASLFKTEDKEVTDVHVQKFCDHVGVEPDEYVALSLGTPAEFSANGVRVLFGYYHMNLPELMKKLRVPALLAYATFRHHDEKEWDQTFRAIDHLKRFNLPVSYRAVEGGHHVHWTDPTLLEDIEAFLTKRTEAVHR